MKTILLSLLFLSTTVFADQVTRDDDTGEAVSTILLISDLGAGFATADIVLKAMITKQTLTDLTAVQRWLNDSSFRATTKLTLAQRRYLRVNYLIYSLNISRCLLPKIKSIKNSIKKT